MKFNLQSEIERARNSVEEYTRRKTLLAHIGTALDVSLAQKHITRMYNDAVNEIVYKESK